MGFYVFCFFLFLVPKDLFAHEGESPEEAHLRHRSLLMQPIEDEDISAPGLGDQAADLVDHYEILSLAAMESGNLTNGALSLSPWTDSYWPTFSGGLANRYQDPKFNLSASWKKNEKYLRKMIGIGSSNELSPAEKYDLLVGDRDFSLTNSLINGSAFLAGEDGEVESWFGLCHGWAPASFSLPRPVRSLRFLADDGRELIFTPSDIKALGTLLWANTSVRTKFVGGRCNQKNPAEDRNRRKLDPECLDNNPATWHLAVVNQIGIAKRSFVMDLEAGREVWNHPIHSYSYDYQNPITFKRTKNLAEAKVDLSDYSNDPFRRYRSPEAKSLVNIEMLVSYLAENPPSSSLMDGPENDSVLTMTLVYDLELDALGNIVGGEWHASNHPDFLWVPVKGSKPRSVGDALLDQWGDRNDWNPGGPMPELWKRAAILASRRQQPLAKIVESLFSQASEPKEHGLPPMGPAIGFREAQFPDLVGGNP